MSEAKSTLLQSVMVHVAEHGMSDLSLREIAAGVGTSHRMLIYHFGSREGLVAAIVEAVEADQRQVLAHLAETATDPTDVIRALWAQVSDPALRPFVRLFYEVVAHAFHGRPGTEGFLDSLTEPWLEQAVEIAERMGAGRSVDDIRLGVAVTRGLLIEVLATGDAGPATASLERFIEMWERS